MGGFRSYILSVVASSLICGCVQMLLGGKGTSSTLVRMLCGVYMAIVLIAPLHRIDFSIYSDYFTGFMEEANSAVVNGENLAEQKRAELIIQQAQSYILDKASSLGADVAVEVILSDDTPPIPCAIVIKGAVSPYVKRMLTSYIEEQFGIPEEAQMWK